ncbi:hypothetical protein BCR35DRAFT_349729 [Leucosporidium creatinivorum]|uniref:SAGA-associated factor 11 n=1 Tax=Leucosporidium creatinivorum TaxID=106004 RepID=A0A1Y2G1Q9_9BASI|nr:hypothetical protein BCR35DRAFT_349729 [Leucosporidium creatinivorum]
MAAQAAEPSVQTLTTLLANGLFKELITDVAIEEHRLAWRRRSRINAARPVLSSASSNGLLGPPSHRASVASSRASSPGPSISPTKKEKDDALLDCLNCSRQIAAPRYASHLSGCMGLGGAGGRARGERRAAAGSSTNPMVKPAVNGVATIGPGSDRASSYASDEETVRKNALKAVNGAKRAATSPANGASKLKKARPANTPPILQQPHVAHVGSHPLSKTLSAPSTPTIPRPTHPYPNQQPSSASMVARKSLPHGQAPQKAPRSVSAQPPPPRPMSAAPPPAPKPGLASDRPDSDSSEDDSDDDKPKGPPPPPRTGMANKTPKKTMPFGRKAHPLARGVGHAGDSDSASDASSGSDSD